MIQLGCTAYNIISEIESMLSEQGIAVHMVAKNSNEESIKLSFNELSDKIIGIMEDSKITNKEDAIVDYISNDLETIKDIVGDMIYEARSTKDERLQLLDELIKLKGGWKLILEELKQEFTIL